MNEVLKHRLHFKKGEDMERKENLLPTRLGSQHKLPR